MRTMSQRESTRTSGRVAETKRRRREGVIKILLKATEAREVVSPEQLFDDYLFAYRKGKLLVRRGSRQFVRRIGWIGERRLRDLINRVDSWPENDTDPKRSGLAKIVDQIGTGLAARGWDPLLANLT